MKVKKEKRNKNGWRRDEVKLEEGARRSGWYMQTGGREGERNITRRKNMRLWRVVVVVVLVTAEGMERWKKAAKRRNG